MTVNLVRHIEQLYMIECSQCHLETTLNTTGREAPHLFATSFFRKLGWSVMNDRPVCPYCQKKGIKK